MFQESACIFSLKCFQEVDLLIIIFLMNSTGKNLDNNINSIFLFGGGRECGWGRNKNRPPFFWGGGVER